MSPEDLAALPDETIDYSDIPELDDDFFRDARLVEPDITRSVTLRIKTSVLDAFKADGKGYQTRMNAVLETYVRSRLAAGLSTKSRTTTSGRSSARRRGPGSP